MRQVMLPYTAQRLTKRKSNTLKDFQSVAGPLGVTHFMIFSKTEQYLYMRIARLQQGPTLTFNVLSYSTMADVIQIQKDPPKFHPICFERPPLVVLNNFVSDNPNIKLASVILQNMFPIINISTIVLRSNMRVVLFDYNKETDTIEMRHYLITMVPVGLSKSVKRLVWNKQIKLGSMDAVEYILKNSAATESDMEDNEENKVVLPVDINSSNKKLDTRAIRLKEIGPRLTMRLMKVEEGFCEGYVVYHLYVKKTVEEKKELQSRIALRNKEKEQRRKDQDQNYKKKTQVKKSR
jgi:ribosome biogenesis protein SSF1/2